MCAEEAAGYTLVVMEPKTSSRFQLVLNIAIAVLLVAALVLGYFVYQKYAPMAESPNEPAVGVVETDAPDTQEASPSSGDGRELKALSDREREALTPPGPGASEEEFQQHFSLVQEVAVNESILLVGEDCVVYPAIMRTKIGTDLTFLNQDSMQHVITFNEEHSYILPPGEPVALSADFGQGAGLYGYGCDEGTAAAGMMLVAE